MRDLMAKRETNRPIPKAVLKALWHVDADPAYRVHRKPNCFDCEYIAVCTLTGAGQVKLTGGECFTLTSSRLISKTSILTNECFKLRISMIFRFTVRQLRQNRRAAQLAARLFQCYQK